MSIDGNVVGIGDNRRQARRRTLKGSQVTCNKGSLLQTSNSREHNLCHVPETSFTVNQLQLPCTMIICMKTKQTSELVSIGFWNAS